MCTVLLPPGDNPIAVNKYIISYHIFTLNWQKTLPTLRSYTLSLQYRPRCTAQTFLFFTCFRRFCTVRLWMHLSVKNVYTPPSRAVVRIYTRSVIEWFQPILLNSSTPCHWMVPPHVIEWFHPICLMVSPHVIEWFRPILLNGSTPCHWMVPPHIIEWFHPILLNGSTPCHWMVAPHIICPYVFQYNHKINVVF
jgi:hypothetical protein